MPLTPKDMEYIKYGGSCMLIFKIIPCIYNSEFSCTLKLQMAH